VSITVCSANRTARLPKLRIGKSVDRAAVIELWRETWGKTCCCINLGDKDPGVIEGPSLKKTP